MMEHTKRVEEFIRKNPQVVPYFSNETQKMKAAGKRDIKWRQDGG